MEFRSIIVIGHVTCSHAGVETCETLTISSTFMTVKDSKGVIP